MTRAFDPSALMNLESALGDGSEIIPAGEEELRRIGGAELRRRCAGIKLAARIVGMAIADREDFTDVEAVHSMERLISRLAAFRDTALEVVGVQPSSPDYPAAFNSVTDTAMDVITEEWKWSRLQGGWKPLPTAGIRQLLEVAAGSGPMYVPDAADRGLDLRIVRRLCVLESIPKLWSVVNMFDYYQPESGPVVARLARAVSEQAEAQVSAWYSTASPSFAVKSILIRMYGVSIGLMCEVYKDAAARDVARLRAMPELDRAVLLAQIERTGMNYDHIIQRHRAVMDRTLDTTRLILEAQHKPQPPARHRYAS